MEWGLARKSESMFGQKIWAEVWPEVSVCLSLVTVFGVAFINLKNMTTGPNKWCRHCFCTGPFSYIYFSECQIEYYVIPYHWHVFGSISVWTRRHLPSRVGIHRLYTSKSWSLMFQPLCVVVGPLFHHFYLLICYYFLCLQVFLNNYQYEV